MFTGCPNDLVVKTLDCSSAYEITRSSAADWEVVEPLASDSGYGVSNLTLTPPVMSDGDGYIDIGLAGGKFAIVKVTVSGANFVYKDWILYEY